MAVSSQDVPVSLSKCPPSCPSTVPQFTLNLPLDLTHHDSEQKHRVSSETPTAHHYPPHSPQHKERTAGPPPNLLLPQKQEQNCRGGSRSGQRTPLAAHANISRAKVRAGNGSRGHASAGVPSTKGNKAQPLQSYPLNHLSPFPPTSSMFLEPHKVLPATGPLLLPFYLPGVSSPQTAP